MRLSTAEIKETVVKSGFATEKELAESEKVAHDQNRTLTDVLIERGVLVEKFLGQILSEKLGYPYADLKSKQISSDILSILPEKFTTEKRLIPFEKKDKTLLVAMENPDDLEAVEFIKKKTNLLVEVYFTLPGVLDEGLDQYRKDIKLDFEKTISENVSEAQKMAVLSATDLPLIKILDTLLDYAASEHASDLHVENVGDRLVVRFRVDGKLKDVLDLPDKIQAGLITRIKILSNLRTDEHRAPQDGRFRFKHRSDEISVRVSILPTYHGEDAVLRLLSSSSRPKSLGEMGLTGESLEIVEGELTKPHGMILATGPTGSGKTTTLYNLLTILNTAEVNICTIEDPIEYGLSRVNQTQVNTSAGLTFANGLRSILRHDPDIILVGEIRDQETAEIAIHSALTGHLVLSSLHTNDAVGAIPRLVDLGTQTYLVGSSLSLIIAQRLVRKNCTSCLVVEDVKEDTKTLLRNEFKEEISEAHIKTLKEHRGKGCNVCNNEGFRGRVGIFEILKVSEKIKELIFAKASAKEIEEQAKKAGFRSMFSDGLNKVQAGLTTIEEIVSAVRE
ncbi:MAG TPA: GspE/PulE family protein [Candidatus Saccharimonadales bacterium]|nr:GspE/PulE family protein [Candidatus Saccharimonadales bacterium]